MILSEIRDFIHSSDAALAAIIRSRVQLDNLSIFFHFFLQRRANIKMFIVYNERNKQEMQFVCFGQSIKSLNNGLYM